MDASIPLTTFLENVTHDWGQKDSRSISDIKAQKIWDPVKIGYLMRASRYLTHSYELNESLETAAAKLSNTPVYFGVSWGTIPSPVGGYNKDTAVQGVMLETNRESTEIAIGLLKKWYPLNPSKPSTPPVPGNYRFVINRDNPSVKGNPVALSNLSVLMERQGIFNNDTKGEQSFCLRDLNMPYKGGRSRSVRDKLLQTTVKTLGDDLLGSPLFLSISPAVNNRSGNKSVWFTFHKKVAQEAISVIRNLPTFFKEEWAINPEYICYAQFINSANSWDAKNRVANNKDTDDIKMAADVYTIDLQKDEDDDAPPEEDDTDSMNTKARKEMRRMMDNDAETINSVSQERRVNPRPSAIVINDDMSQGGMSGVSGTSSRTSVIRAKIQKEFNEKMEEQTALVRQLQQEKEAQAQQFNQLTTQLAKLQAAMNTQSNVQSKPTTTQGILKPPEHGTQAKEPLTHREEEQPNTPPIKDDHNTESEILEQNNQPQEQYLPTSSDEAEFDPTTTYDNNAAIITEIENRIISHLDHSPTPEELITISIEADRLAATMDLDHLEPTPFVNSPSTDSDDIKSPKPSKMRRSFPDSDDDSNQNDSPTRQKRLAITPSDDASDSSQHFAASASTSPKKKPNATGGQSPTDNG